MFQKYSIYPNMVLYTKAQAKYNTKDRAGRERKTRMHAWYENNKTTSGYPKNECVQTIETTEKI
jgi:hypothetical protein